MRQIGILILGLLICMCYYSGRQIDSRTQAVLHPLRKALEAESVGNDRLRDRAVAEAKHAWEDSLTVYSCLLSHTRTDEVSVGFSELPLMSGTDFRRGCARLITQLEGISEMDRLHLRNIL